METSNRRHYFADPTSLSHASQGSLSAVELDSKSHSLSHNSIFEGPFFLVPSRDWISITFSPLITSSALLPLFQIREWGSGSVEREELLEVIKEDATCSPASSIYLTLASSGLTAYPVLSYPSKHIRPTPISSWIGLHNMGAWWFYGTKCGLNCKSWTVNIY